MMSDVDLLGHNGNRDEASQESFHVLLVEDSDDDMVLTREGFRRAPYDVEITHVTNGSDCLAYVNDRAAPRIDLIMLDLNLPGMNGHEILRELRQGKSPLTTPVIVLSTSAVEEDVRKTYQLGGNSYVVKSLDFTEFVENICRISQFWFQSASLPPRGK